MQEYKTVRSFAEAEYEDRHSRFIGAVMPVSCEQQAVDFINARRQSSPGARHNVYAYLLRENNTARYSDDGEPHSTAGMPTLDVLKKRGLTDCCIVTTRYFGGVLLGTGGLVRAYTAAASLAVEAAGVAVMKECFLCRAVCGYADYPRAEQVISLSGKVRDTAFTDTVTVEFSVESWKYDNLCENFREAFCGNILPEIVGKGYYEA